LKISGLSFSESACVLLLKHRGKPFMQPLRWLRLFSIS